MNERPRQAGETMGVLLVLVSAASFAALAIFAKLAYKAGGATLPVLNWRFILASLCMAVYFLFSKRNLRLPLRDIGILFLLGALGYGSMSTFFFMSLQYINASTASMFLYTYPALVTLLSFAIWRKPLRLKQLIALVGAGLGTTILLWDHAVSLNSIGVAYALGSSVAYSIYLVANQHLARRIDPAVASGYIIFSAAAAFTLVNIALGGFTWRFSANAWTAIGLMALISTTVAITTLVIGVKFIGAAQASILSTFEPLVTVLLAIALLGEKLTTSQMVGGGLILAGILVTHWPEKPENEPASQSIAPAGATSDQAVHQP
jgi:drug/metabolite transporter (DMT)-like permease